MSAFYYRNELEKERIENAALKRALKAFMTQFANAESDRDIAQTNEGKLEDEIVALRERCERE